MTDETIFEEHTLRNKPLENVLELLNQKDVTLNKFIKPLSFKISVTEEYCPLPISNAKIPFNLRIFLDL